ncbi:MAG: hypothetical protein ACODAJ_09150 [Planctomycetota bacterium]
MDMGKRAFPIIDKWLASPDPDDRDRGVRDLVTLARRQGELQPQAVERLVRIGSTDQDRQVRLKAAHGLVALGWPESDRQLRQAVQDSKETWKLVELLFETGDDQAAGRLGQSVLKMAQADAAARDQALELLPTLARRSRQRATRRQALALVGEFARHRDPDVATRGVRALVELARPEDPLTRGVPAQLFEIAVQREEPAVRQAAVEGLARLKWRPLGESARRKLVEMGPAGLPILDSLLADPDATVRLSAVPMVSRMAKAHPEARDAVLQRHRRLAARDKNAGVVRLAVQGLRALGWPQDEEEWAALTKLGEGAAGIIHWLLVDGDEEVRARAAESLGQVGAAHAGTRDYAVARLLHLMRVDQSQRVRCAASAALVRLRWPETEADWAQIEKMGAGALCFLLHLARADDAALREKALAKGAILCRNLLALAERNMDNVALLHGLELKWDIDIAARRKKIRDLVAKSRLEHASAVFGEALTECEAAEKRLHGLIVETGVWPSAGVANKWQELLDLLLDDDLAKLRKSWPLTIGNWKTTLQKRGEDAKVWRQVYRQAADAGGPQATLAVIDQFMKRHPQSFYSQFAWKWKDVLRSQAEEGG